ncbi:nucleoside hydrolase [Candidatus Pacearchaeota archaeon]|nr:nucleoside hydrolase [Candidatus Pacearchaeota archaeon]
MSKKILLSTDIGSDVDDALALLTMLNHPEIDLRGIYTVNGDVDARSYIAKHMVDLAGRNIPVARGEPYAFSLVKPYSLGECERFLVDDKFIDRSEWSRDIKYVSLDKAGINSNGVKDLSEKLLRDSSIVFSIAPLTNIAKLLRDYPKSAKNIERLFIMSARLPSENGEELEHNFRYDSVSAREVLSSEIPITIVPGDVCERYRLPINVRENRFSRGLGVYVNKMLRAFVGRQLVRAYHTEIIQGLPFILDNDVKPNFDPEKISPEELERAERFKQSFLADVTEGAAYIDTDEFWMGFYKLVEQLRDPRYGYSRGNLVSLVLEGLVPQGVSIADVYVPYCFLHPEKLRTKRMTIDCDFDGETLVLPGQKHEVVRDLDFDHFKEFLDRYLK